MRIDFDLTGARGPYDFDKWDGSSTYLRDYMATLTFSIGPYTIKYFGQGHDDYKAALMAIQSFLDGELTMEVSYRNIPCDPRLEFGPMSPELKNIIENAIDLKTGNCRNKLAEYFHEQEV